MIKTTNFFLIHNYNTVPTNLLEYCTDYEIIDASDAPGIREEMTSKGMHFKSVKNTGHNITSYFHYFAEHYDDLPEVIVLCKGNMIGRHMSKEYFDKVYNNKYFTYLYEDKVQRAQLVKIDDFDDLLKFIYIDPVVPKWCLFSPGACYIIRREQIRKHTPAFYTNLCKIMDYDLDPNFPSEAHQIERMLPVIFESSYEENVWMNDEKLFEDKLIERREYIQRKEAWNKKRLKRLRLLLGEDKGF